MRARGSDSRFACVFIVGCVMQGQAFAVAKMTTSLRVIHWPRPEAMCKHLHEQLLLEQAALRGRIAA